MLCNSSVTAGGSKPTDSQVGAATADTTTTATDTKAAPALAAVRTATAIVRGMTDYIWACSLVGLGVNANVRVPLLIGIRVSNR